MNFDHFDFDTKMSDMLGLKLTSIVVNDSRDEIAFYAEGGRVFKMAHYQSCCESVSIESIVGDLNDLIGEPLLISEEATSSDEPPKKREGLGDYVPESYTWTFYKLATRKGYVDIRWLGESNGYYSDGVDLVEGRSDDR